MAFSFPGGVRDAEGRRGYIAIGRGIVAMELEGGTVLWRRQEVGRPLAATIGRVLALDRDGREFVLHLLDASTGAEAARIERFGMPSWADVVGTAVDAVQVEASETASGFRVSWRVRRPYRGGAPPPAQLEMQARDVSEGTVLVDPESGQVSLALTPAPPTEETAPVPPDLGPHAAYAVNVLGVERVSHRLFRLATQAAPDGTVRAVLEAQDARDGSVIWKTTIAQLDAVQPSPQRPVPLRR